ncbi:hypothetical protein ABH37_03450 [Mycobacterium haemophilum]|uniref:Uncharacterized protein n=1 Tax=Mycobacterium haemophilum TaxID=29311 RepID=A0A0I9YFE9_9MYCO|nr:hypothetical protein ABH39_06980 [Mycobacterium haemophilum]KLO38632.1 hypothetical protein ABH38_04555 [Mycobacterium haemophilum]KLO44966.1 hypothetical protein ABH37_03450 [Mycobacterium haemophilum]KLO56310.1 hypothetical protein ABH36_03430 [Mycobacterium haemophilum]
MSWGFGVGEVDTGLSDGVHETFAGDPNDLLTVGEADSFCRGEDLHRPPLDAAVAVVRHGATGTRRLTHPPLAGPTDHLRLPTGRQHRHLRTTAERSTTPYRQPC